MPPSIKPRYVARSFCRLDDPEAVSTWIILDTRTGMPVPRDGAIRLFTKDEMRDELETLNVAPGLIRDA